MYLSKGLEKRERVPRQEPVEVYRDLCSLKCFNHSSLHASPQTYGATQGDKFLVERKLDMTFAYCQMVVFKHLGF